CAADSETENLYKELLVLLNTSVWKFCQVYYLLFKYLTEKKNIPQLDACLRCQAECKKDSLGRQDCVVVWGECNHSFHHCCMSLWVKQNNRCPLCQQEWSIQRMGK
ncbi:RING-box protein 2, partial [Pseudolycoriella hygida]